MAIVWRPGIPFSFPLLFKLLMLLLLSCNCTSVNQIINILFSPALTVNILMGEGYSMRAVTEWVIYKQMYCLHCAFCRTAWPVLALTFLVCYYWVQKYVFCFKTTGHLFIVSIYVCGKFQIVYMYIVLYLIGRITIILVKVYNWIEWSAYSICNRTFTSSIWN